MNTLNDFYRLMLKWKIFEFLKFLIRIFKNLMIILIAIFYSLVHSAPPSNAALSKNRIHVNLPKSGSNLITPEALRTPPNSIANQFVAHRNQLVDHRNYASDRNIQRSNADVPIEKSPSQTDQEKSQLSSVNLISADDLLAGIDTDSLDLMNALQQQVGTFFSLVLENTMSARVMALRMADDFDDGQRATMFSYLFSAGEWYMINRMLQKGMDATPLITRLRSLPLDEAIEKMDAIGFQGIFKGRTDIHYVAPGGYFDILTEMNFEKFRLFRSISSDLQKAAKSIHPALHYLYKAISSGKKFSFDFKLLEKLDNYQKSIALAIMVNLKQWDNAKLMISMGYDRTIMIRLLDQYSNIAGIQAYEILGNSELYQPQLLERFYYLLDMNQILFSGEAACILMNMFDHNSKEIVLKDLFLLKEWFIIKRMLENGMDPTSLIAKLKSLPYNEAVQKMDAIGYFGLFLAADGIHYVKPQNRNIELKDLKQNNILFLHSISSDLVMAAAIWKHFWNVIGDVQTASNVDIYTHFTDYYKSIALAYMAFIQNWESARRMISMGFDRKILIKLLDQYPDAAAIQAFEELGDFQPFDKTLINLDLLAD